jgi:NAD+ synthase
MDLCLFARNHGVDAAEVAQAAGLTPSQVERAFKDIDTKRSTTRYQHLAPFLVDDIPGVGSSHGLRATKT